MPNWDILVNKRVRMTQSVSAIADHIRVVRCVIKLEEDGVKLFKGKVVEKFPSIFGGKYTSNIQKASEWWCRFEHILDSEQRSNTARVSGRAKRTQQKVANGRGRKRASLVVLLHSILMEEFLLCASSRSS